VQGRRAGNFLSPAFGNGDREAGRSFQQMLEAISVPKDSGDFCACDNSLNFKYFRRGAYTGDGEKAVVSAVKLTAGRVESFRVAHPQTGD
jgi:hypothetical protein